MNQSRHSIDGMDSMRSHSSHSSSSVPRYIANQRFGPRPNEAESMMHAKRKAAAQRERELRNYHQAQQYNRSNTPSRLSVALCPASHMGHADMAGTDLTGAKSDRSTSPNAMNEGDRRELIARQHRALYGNDSNLYMNEGAPGRPMSQDPRALASASGASGSNSMAFDPYATPASAAPAAEPNPSMQAIGGSQSRSRSNSTASPATNQGQFGVYDNPQQIHSQSSPRGSPTRAGAQGPPSGVAPIGTRPMGGKRNTPPMPSPLGYGYPNEKSNQATAERSQSAASNPTSAGADKSVGMGWGGNGAWGSNKMQASVWG